MKLMIAILTFAFVVYAGAQTSKEAVKGKAEEVVKADTSEMLDSQVDSVNISQMVQEQIDAARAKASEEKSKPVLQVEVKKTETPQKTEAGFWPELRKFIPVSSDTVIKASVILVFSFFVFGIIFFRRLVFRKNKPKKSDALTDLKKNISLLREEKPLKVKDKNKLRLVRSKLLQNYSSVKMTNEKVSQTAKELKIAKGELLLAERINLHKMAGGYAGKK